MCTFDTPYHQCFIAFLRRNYRKIRKCVLLILAKNCEKCKNAIFGVLCARKCVLSILNLVPLLKPRSPQKIHLWNESSHQGWGGGGGRWRRLGFWEIERGGRRSKKMTTSQFVSEYWEKIVKNHRNRSIFLQKIKK